MRKLAAVTLLWFLMFAPALAQKGGVQFRPATVAAAFDAARKARKPLFVEIYSPTCHVCQSFIPTFNDTRVGKYYNEKFVSVKFDVTKPETQNFLKKSRIFVPSLPLFLYFSPQGDLVHMAMSNNAAEEVIRHGMNALTPTARAAGYQQRYNSGERSANFLIDYGMYARVTSDTATNIRLMNEYVRQVPANSYTNQTNWLVLQKLIMDVDNPLFQYMVSNLGQYAPKYGADLVRQTAENILMSSLYSSRGNQYPAPKIQKIREQLVQIGISPQVANNRTLLPEVNAYFRAGQVTKAVQRMDAHATQNNFSVPEYLYVIRLFNGKSTDASDVPTVIKWANKAISQATSPKEQSELYYEQAEAYRRAGRKSDGLKAAQKSLEMAKSAKLDTRRHTEQIAQLQ